MSPIEMRNALLQIGVRMQLAGMDTEAGVVLEAAVLIDGVEAGELAIAVTDFLNCHCQDANGLAELQTKYGHLRLPPSPSSKARKDISDE